jgi:hydroxypyruvate reductase
VTKELLRCGAPIQEVNTVRKHLSAIQGGRLAAATRARVLALIVSDVTGNDPTHIASGPCAPDPTTYADALGVLTRYAIDPPAAVRRRLEDGARGALAETPKPGDAVFARVENRIIATARRSLEAAAGVLEKAGIASHIVGDAITGEAREVAKGMAATVREIRAQGGPLKPPVALISGGECTVTVKSQRGRGGRCAEFLLALGIELASAQDIWAIAADTDGIDGSEDNAGALLAPDSLARARAHGLEAAKLLAANDSWGFFSAIGDLLVTGPTRTNVSEYRCILVL